MDFTSIVLIIALFAILIVSGFLILRKSVKAKIDGPLGMELDMDASSQVPQVADDIIATSFKKK